MCAAPQVVRQRVFTLVKPIKAKKASTANISNPV